MTHEYRQPDQRTNEQDSQNTWNPSLPDRQKTATCKHARAPGDVPYPHIHKHGKHRYPQTPRPDRPCRPANQRQMPNTEKRERGRNKKGICIKTPSGKNKGKLPTPEPQQARHISPGHPCTLPINLLHASGSLEQNESLLDFLPICTVFVPNVESQNQNPLSERRAEKRSDLETSRWMSVFSILHFFLFFSFLFFFLNKKKKDSFPSPFFH